MAKTTYPTAYQIEDMFQWRESPETCEKFDAVIADQVDAKIMGHDHHLAGEYKGKTAWREGSRARFHGMHDPNKRPKPEIINVIGGGESPWACVELKTTGRAKSGRWYQSICFALQN